MNTIEQTAQFSKWFTKLADMVGKALIVHRIDAAILGNLGDTKSVGDGVSEMRIHTGPGYRLYFTARGNTIIFLLNGGTKSTQKRDIEKAKALAKGI